MMHIGVIVPQQELGTDPRAIIDWATNIEQLGYGYVEVFDHVLGADVSERLNWPGPYTHEHEFHEPFVLLAFLAAHTGLDLSTGVLVLPQRQTALVAKQAAELDILSGGRFRLGVGIGWNRVEAEALGTTFETRAHRYEEQIHLLRRLWSEPIVDHRGEHHRIDRAGIAPLPKRMIPIWMGGSAPAALDRIGRLADGWIAWDSSAADVEADIAMIRRSSERAGRDPGAVEIQGRIDIHGPLDLDRFMRALDRWVDANVSHLSIHLRDQPSLPDHAAALTRIAEILRDRGLSTRREINR